MDQISSPDRRPQNPEARIAVERALQELFDILKEHGASLSTQDIETLSNKFTVEVGEYIESLLERIKQAREKRTANKN